jgi:hypothetical protein
MGMNRNVVIGVCVTAVAVMSCGCCGAVGFLVREFHAWKKEDLDRKAANRELEDRPAFSAKPSDLFRTYAKNEEDADHRFLGKRIEVVGDYNAEFGTVTKRDDGVYTYTFKEPGNLPKGNPRPKPLVVIVFRESENSKLEKLKANVTIRVVGRCEGLRQEDDHYGQCVILEDAVLKSP